MNMTQSASSLSELAAILKEMYHGANDGEMTTMIHLFGVKYAKQLRDLDNSYNDVAVAAGIQKDYGAEIGKGVRLARYVEVK